MPNNQVSSPISSSLHNVRGTAACLVILIHAASQDFYGTSSHWWLSAVGDAFSRCCVPMFLMLSGALLIKKDLDISIFIKKRVIKIIPPLFFWGVAYLLFIRFYWGWTQEVKPENILDVFLKSPYVHLWYLYYIVGMYLFIPILSKWYINSNLKEKTFFVMIFLFCSSAMQFQGIHSVVNYYGTSNFTSYIFYFVIGAYLLELYEKAFTKGSAYVYLIVYTASSTMLALITWGLSKINGKVTYDHLNYNNPLVILSASMLFVFWLKIEKKSKILTSLSLSSLGIYCIHMMWMAPINSYIDKLGLLYPFKLILLTSGVIFSSAVCIYIMRKMKIFKNFI